jgi:predicted TIM-barrel fold metal-dependent hydrolase
VTSTSAPELRAQLDHPVIDIDGHTTESVPALGEYFRAEGVDPHSPTLKRLLPGVFGPIMSWYDLSAEERASRRVSRPPWWGAPARNTRDLATALCPRLLHERMDELGIDFSVTYPSLGLVFMHLDREDERRGTCRALNRYNAEAFADLSDRLTPVAAIPMHTPQEAVEDIEYAVATLGYKAVLLAGYVQRPVEAMKGRDPELEQYARWIDMYGIDSAYDYDPVWAKCVELGVSVAFHSGSIGWGSRVSISNYMYNHLGHLAEGHHSLAKSLFLGGVTRRFPTLNFSFLEGGVAWAVTLYSDLIGHWEKRNRKALDHINPANVDQGLLADLLGQYAHSAATNPAGRPAARPTEPEDMLDEFAALGVDRAEQIKDLFVPNFFFGCEADDPMTSTAFNDKVNPFGARLQAMFGSDVAHWDVPDMTEVLGEAWEMVEHGLITERDFRDFMFTNPVNCFTRTNPSFFKGTAVEGAVDTFLGAR